MRHRVKTKQFNRDTNHRKALLVNLVRSLVTSGSIVTTKAKAKEVKRLSDKIISQAQKNTLHSRRQIHEFFGKRSIVNILVDNVAPAMKDRRSGFSKIVVVGKRRGDNSEMVRLELVEKLEVGSKKKEKRKVAKLQSGKVAKQKENEKVTKKQSSKVAEKKNKSVSQVDSGKGKDSKVKVSKTTTKKIVKPTQNRVKGK